MPIGSLACLSSGLAGPCSSEGVVRVMVTPPGTFNFSLPSSSEMKQYSWISHVHTLAHHLNINKGVYGALYFYFNFAP